ncbi:cytochrome P450 [Nocardia sp. GAS34]|uniref:cytochrome P450 n=1 Tax=unclassified Nocardia TaxID=2637762 RepID=UPI003D1EA7BB
MRGQFGALAPVELAPGVPATLVLDYRTAVRILYDPERFPADPRVWQSTVGADCPVLPIMRWRPVASRSTATAHVRYRQVVVATLDAVDLFDLHQTVETTALSVIDEFSRVGTADLVSQYAFPLTFAVVNALLGCPAEIGQRVVHGMAALLDCERAESGYTEIIEALSELVALKRTVPGDDIVTRMLHHSAALDDAEIIEEVMELYGGGIEPLQNLICNALLLMLTDERFGGGVVDGSLLTRDAIDEVLFTNPPLTNFCISYPRQPILLGGVWLPAHQPVLISIAACNGDPALGRIGDYTGNRSHLAWSAGPHTCPARSVAYLTAQDAIDQLLDVLPEISLAVTAEQLEWRPGPFHRSLRALPVEFPPLTPTGARG